MLRADKFRGLRGPGLFWVVPVLDTIPVWIDHRVMVTPFNAEKTLTKDTVPVDVDAVLFWVVCDVQKAALEVEDYRAAIAWAAQTALRDTPALRAGASVIGKMVLADILVGRDAIDPELQRITLAQHASAGRRAHHVLGVNVSSVEIRDVLIPPGLEDAMSRQAQAERERHAGAGQHGRGAQCQSRVERRPPWPHRQCGSTGLCRSAAFGGPKRNRLKPA